jgi:hypothetical protein
MLCDGIAIHPVHLSSDHLPPIVVTSTRRRSGSSSGRIAGVIGSIVGAGMSWRLMVLQGEFDAFTREEFTATQRMADLALNLSKLRGQEKSAIINTGDSVTAEGHMKGWKAALADSAKAADELATAIGEEAEAETVWRLCEHLSANGRARKVAGGSPFAAKYLA